MIEQAVFTSAKTERAQGYQLLARSAGLTEADARELALWGPSHGSLLAHPGECSSSNFFKLASGSYCVSRTTVAGVEYSGRGGALVYTQFLVVPPELLLRFGNNPFAILRAAAASGVLCVHDPVPVTLEPVRLAGRAPAVDLGLLAQLARDPGPAAIATLVHSALTSERLAIFSEAPTEQLIAGLFNVLPVECRTEFSFATGLKFSPSRFVRLSALPAEQSSWRALERAGVTILRLDSTSHHDDEHWEGWAAWLAGLFSSGKLSLLAAELEQARPGLSCGDLNDLTAQLQAGLGGAGNKQASTPRRSRKESLSPTAAHSPRGESRQRADAAHKARHGLLVEGRSRMAQLDQLADKLAQQPPAILELLERIDDLVFAAISGDRQALEELQTLWPKATAQLDEELLELSREQYLRCALSICTDVAEDEVIRPERALSAVDVLCVLFEE